MLIPKIFVKVETETVEILCVSKGNITCGMLEKLLLLISSCLQ